MQLQITDETPPDGYQRLLFAEDQDSGLRAFICIHSTVCGPAAGGCRMWHYGNIAAARNDVLRLAAGMTSKNAIAGLALGGGKAVIIGDPRLDKSEALLRAFGAAVHSLSGQYYTAEDVGISPADMAIVAQETPFAVGLDRGSHASGDPSPFTAEGVFQCLKVGAQDVFGSDDLNGRRVLVQGLGHVGWPLASKLQAAGATLIVSDINQAVVDRARLELAAEVCAPDQVFAADMEVFAPCALGAVLSHDSAVQLRAKLVCGAANNQLANAEVAADLRQRGIRYLPDYVVNAGGIISVASEIFKAGENYRNARLAGVADRIREILLISNATGKTTTRVADDMVAEILASGCRERGAA